jgi:hypothetical protein
MSSFVLGMLTTLNANQAWHLLGSRWWPWGFMSATVAGCVAYAIDQEAHPRVRWRDTGLLAVACAAVAFPVVRLLHDTCQCTEPQVWRVVLNALVTGGLVGFFVPTWYRRPQTMVSSYKRFRLVVAAGANSEGRIVATIDVTPPKVPGESLPRAERLPETVETDSADDAIGEAIRTAREWIDLRLASPEAVPATLPGPARNGASVLDGRDAAIERPDRVGSQLPSAPVPLPSLS